MKKFFAIALVLLICGTMFVGADDASVMPGGIGRFYVAPTFGFAPGGFNAHGQHSNYGDKEGSMQLFNLGFALEYGIIDWLTAAVQWAPGWNLWSDVDTSLGSDSSVNANGVADLFVGAKILLIGNNGLVQHDVFRFSVAPGVKIPLPGPDFEEQWKNVPKNDPVTAANVDNHVLGAGMRFYWDYVLNEKFYLNLYSEFISYPVKGDIFKSGINPYAAEAMSKGGLMAMIPDDATLTAMSIPFTQAQIFGMIGNTKFIDGGTVDYGYDLTFEMEPVYSTFIADKTKLSAGLPFNLKVNPAKKYSVDVTDDLKAMAGMFAALMPGLDDMIKGGIEGGLNGSGNSTYIFTIKPNVSLFFMGWALPTEFKLQYSGPVAGMGVNSLHTITMQVKLYFKI